MDRRHDRAYLERLTRELTDQGKLIEAGWIGLRLAAIPDKAPAIQLSEMRMALIHKELEAFLEDFKLRHCTTKGSA